MPGSASLLTQLIGLDAQMLVAHLAAAVLVGLWLATGERAVWSLLTHIWRALRLPALLLPSTPVTGGVPAQQQTGQTLARLASGTVVRRGPPHLLAARQSPATRPDAMPLRTVPGASARSVLPGPHRG
jgi:hypothetical protein